MPRPLSARVALVLLVLLLSACANTHTQLPGPPATATSTPPSSTSSPPTMARPQVVVGLGDSVTAGSMCNCRNFVTLYAAGLPSSAGGPGTPINLGVSGETTGSLRARLDSAKVSVELGRADVVLITVGANDLVPLIDHFSSGVCPAACYQPAVLAMSQGFQDVLRRIHSLIPPTAHVVVTDYWNVFEDGDVGRLTQPPGFPAWSDAVTRAANARICSDAAALRDQCVDLYRPFKGDGDADPTGLLAGDGDHPNAAGHALIARTLLSVR